MAIVWTDRERRKWRPYTVGDALRGIDPATGGRGTDPGTGYLAPALGYAPAEGYPPPMEWIVAANTMTRTEWDALWARTRREEASRMAFERHSRMPEARGTKRMVLDAMPPAELARMAAEGCASVVPDGPGGEGSPDAA